VDTVDGERSTRGSEQMMTDLHMGILSGRLRDHGRGAACGEAVSMR
jgi:hypothetical protein